MRKDALKAIEAKADAIRKRMEDPADPGAPLLMLEKRSKAAKEIKQMADKAISENRVFNETEQRIWDVLNKHYDKLTEDIDEFAEAFEKRTLTQTGGIERRGNNMRTGLPGQDDVNHRASARDGRDDYGTGAGVRFVDQKGREVRSLRPNESFRSAVCPEDSSEELCIGKCIVGLATGKWEDAEAERRTMLGATTTAGGVLIPDTLSSRVIDLARAKTVIMAAGAQTVPMDSATLTLARVTQDPTAHWRSETQQIGVSEPSLGAAILQAKSLAALVTLSLELVEDAPNAAAVVQNCLTQAIGLEMDRGLLRGQGAANEPMGIRNYPGVNTTAIGGLLSFDNMLDSMTPIEVANGSPNAWICDPAVNGYLRKLKDGNGQYLVGHPALDELKRLVSNQCPVDELYVGDFSKVVVGLRKSITIEVFRSGTAGGLDAVDRMLVHIRAHMRGDIILLQPTHFNVLTGITL